MENISDNKKDRNNRKNMVYFVYKRKDSRKCGKMTEKGSLGFIAD